MDIAGMVAATFDAIAQETCLAADIAAVDEQRRTLVRAHIEALGAARRKCDGLAAFGIAPDELPSPVRQWCEQDRHQRRVEKMT